MAERPGSFFEDLQAELVAAASRPSSPPRWRRPRTLVAAAVVVAAIVVAGAAVVLLRGSDTVEAFGISTVGDTVEIRVVDGIEDLDAAEVQLAELGVDATLQSLPTSPTLVGRVVAIEERPFVFGAPEAEIVSGPSRTVELIRLPAGYSGTIQISVGRPAEPGEMYAASEAPPICDELAGLTVAEVLPELLDVADSLRWQLSDAETFELTELTLDELDTDNAYVVNILPLDSESALVLTSTSADSPEPRCF